MWTLQSAVVKAAPDFTTLGHNNEPLGAFNTQNRYTTSEDRVLRRPFSIALLLRQSLSNEIAQARAAKLFGRSKHLAIVAVDQQYEWDAPDDPKSTVFYPQSMSADFHFQRVEGGSCRDKQRSSLFAPKGHVGRAFWDG